MLDTCEEFTGWKDKDGYGTKSYRGKTWRAHRLAWTLVNGEIPEGLCILHRCDNPPCVNVEHLFLGTQEDNIRDRDKKGREAQGTKINFAKLSEQQIIEIRNEYLLGNISQRKLATKYNIQNTTLGSIVRRETWKHI